ncbi:MAG: class I adenylate-forming enzyme family protein [Pseudomonadota bacterium]
MSRRNLGATLTGNSEKTALIDLSTPAAAQYSFDQLDALINGFAASLNPTRGQRIGLLAANSAAFVTTLFGIMRAGGVAVPINTKFPDATVSYVIQDAELSDMYADEANQVRLTDGHPLALVTAADYNAIEPQHGESGLVLYTSGSTGTPKGVELSHDSQWAMVERLQKPLGGATGIIAAPLYHMNGLLFLMSLFAGKGTVVLMPRFEARAYLQAIHDHRVNIITGVPTMLSLMLQERDLIESLDLSSVMAIQIGSAPLSETIIEQVNTLFPNARLSNGYGTTEAGAGMFGPHPDGIRVPTISLGYPQPHVDVRLVGRDSESEGVLEVRTPAAMNRYLNLPEKTSEKMSTDGWINTGDIMRRDEHGFYYFVGRDDDMFNCGGENVYPGEVERILEKDARIQECCVVPVADDIKGQLPVVFVVTAAGQVISEDEVKTVALEHAPAYMHPRRVFFLDSMPLAGTNKIDRHVLTQQANESR